MVELLREIIICGLLLGGLFFLAVGALGLIRLPDVFTRMHATGKCDTLGAGMILAAMFLLVPGLTDKVKIALMGFLIATINPVMAHLIALVTYNRGQPPAKGTWTFDYYDYGKESRSEDNSEEEAD